MADLNLSSSNALAEYREGAVTASKIQPYDGGDGGYYIGDTYFYQDTMYTLRIDPKSGSTVTIDGIVLREPGMVSASQVDITGKLATPPTNVPGTSSDGDASGCAIWVSDGTSPYGAAGDIYASKRLAVDGSLTHACLAPFTRMYSDVESGSDATIAADGSDTSLGVSIASLPPGTYWMSYSFTYVPTTAWNTRTAYFWVQGSTAGVLASSVSGCLPQDTGTQRFCTCVSWVQTLTATDTLTLYGKYSASGADTITVESTSYSTVLLAVRIA
jgi:hypothetical protein